MAFLDRFFGWHGESAAPTPARTAWEPALAVQAYTVLNIDDPAVAEFLRAGFESSTGVAVNDKVALRNSTFFRSVALIAGAVGMLPLHLMEQNADGGNKRKARQHPLFKILHRRPNRFQTAFEFKSYLQTVALLDGNAYAMVVRTGRRISQIVPLPRKSITPELTDTFDIRFKYQRPSGGTVYLSSREVFHFRHPVSLDGLNGISLKDVATETIGIASIAQRAAGKLFKNGTFSGGALETDKELGDEALQHLRDSLEDRFGGSENSGRWMVLEQGLKAKTLACSAKDAQHIETREHEAEEMSRFTGVPRPLLMFDETSWGSGIEQLGLFFVTYCLQPWLEAWEEAVDRILEEDEQDRLYAKFNVGALLRGSLKDQAEFFAKALGSGGSAAWMMQNEVRENFDMNPADGGDVLHGPSGAAAAATKEEDPGPEPKPRRRRRKDDDDED